MKKRILSLMLTLTMLASICVFMPLNASAEAYSPAATVDWNGHTYHFYDEKMTWEEAKKYCENSGGYLATFTTEDEWNAIHEQIMENGNHYWFGGYGKGAIDTWIWITGEQWTYSDWCSGEPNNDFGGRENYLGTYTGSYQWNDYRPDVELGFICEFGNIVTQQRYVFDEHTYQIFDSSMSWEDAKSFCEALDGHLVSINSKDENEFIESIIDGAKQDIYWTGGSKEENSDVWQWLDGTLLTYTNWAQDEPNNDDGREAYIEIVKTPFSAIEFGQWNDNEKEGDRSSRSYGFICEWGEQLNIENDNKSFMEQIEGVYVGRYTATQGVTGATLTIEETDTGNFSTIFEFYPVAENADVESGSYTMNVSYEDSKYEMIGTTWVVEAPTYIFADLKNVKYDGYSLSGDVYGQKAGFLGFGTTYGEVGEFEFVKVGASNDSIFEFGRDNYSFLNSPYDFNNQISKYLVNVEDFNMLVEGQSNSVKYNILKYSTSDWGGSCHGMSASATLNLDKRINPSDFTKNAKKLYDLEKPKDNLDVKSLVNYYQIMLDMPDWMLERSRQSKLGSEDAYYFVNGILDKAFEIKTTNVPVIMWFYWYVDNNDKVVKLEADVEKKPYAHAVLIYDIKTTKKGYTLSVYDPNHSKSQTLTISKDLKSCKYGDMEYFADDIPNSTFAIYFTTNDLKLIDLKNIDGKGNNVNLYDYKDVYFKVDGGSNFEMYDTLRNTSNILVAYQSPELSGGNMLPSPMTTVDGDARTDVTFAINNSSYKVIPTTNSFDGTMIYPNNTINANVKNADEINYSNNGEVELLGEDMDYSTAIVKESPYFGEIYQVSVSGNNANEIELTNKNGGILLTGDNLKNVKIEAIGDEITDTFEIAGDFDDLYVNGNKDVTKIYSDLNEDGYYEENEVIDAINHNDEETSFGSTVSNWAKEEVEEAYDENLIPEVLVGKDLTQKVDRAEFAAIAVALYENLTGSKATKSNNPFNDIYGNACEDDILKAYNLDITTGTSATTFEPNINITREQMATMLTRAYKKSEFKDWTIAKDADYPLNFMGVQKFADDSEISDYAKESVYFMARWDIIKGVGDNRFAPKNSATLGESYGYATREQAVIIALRSAKHL